MDQQDLASYTPAQIYANSVTETAIKTQTDKLAFTVTNQVDANVLDWKSTPAPTMTGDAYAVANSRLPAALTANGNIKASLVEILTTALTETAGQIATAFIKFFNEASPTGTVNSLPDAVAGANGGLTTTNGAKVNQTVDLTSGQSIAVSDKTGFSLSTAGILAIWNQLETDAGLIANSIGLKLHTLLVSAGGKVSAILLRWLTDDAPGTPNALDGSGNVKVVKNASDVSGTDFSTTEKSSITSSVPSVSSIQSGLATPTNITSASGVSLSSAGILAIWNQLTSDVGIISSSFASKLKNWVYGTDYKSLISTDAQDVSTTFHVDAKTLNSATPNNLAIGAKMDIQDIPNPTAITAIQNGLSKPGTAQTITPPADMALNSTVAKDATVMKSASYVAPDNVDIISIKNITDQIRFTIANQIDANLLTGGGGATVDEIWDALISGFTTPNSIGLLLSSNVDEKLSVLLGAIYGISSGQLSASAVWNYLLTTIGITGSIGELIKDNLDAKVSDIISTVSQTSTSSTSADNYYINNAVTVSIAFKDKSGNPIDPTTVTLQVKDPTNTINSYTFGVGSQIVKDSLGNYHSDIDGDIAGNWVYVWDGSGNVLISGAGSFSIVDPFVPQISTAIVLVYKRRILSIPSCLC